jgi:hypothetical protein
MSQKKVVGDSFRYYPTIWLEGLRKNNEEVNHESWTPDLASNTVPPE